MVTFLHNSLMNILQNIFIDHNEEMIYTLHPRDSVIENVEKMINCGTPSFGGAMYGCPHCRKLKFVPFRCHSRFCPTCGNLYAMRHTASMSFKPVNVTHLHCVSTQVHEFHPGLYHSSPHLWQGFEMEPPYPLPDFGRRLQ